MPRLACAVLVVILGLPAAAAASAESAQLRARALTHAYNLDYDDAMRDMRAAIAADPLDATAHRGMATLAWLQIVFRRGAITVDEYLGDLTEPNVALRAPPADLAELFRTSAQQAATLAAQGLAARPRDPQAHYEAGAIAGLQASFNATVEGRMLAALKTGRQAFSAHERVLEMAPSRHDAALLAGMYRYVVSGMPLAMRLMAYVAGFGGDKARGLKLVEEAAANPSDVQVDAKFALVLLYTREGRHAETLNTLLQLQQLFPRNRLLWLEAGAAALRAGRPADAERFLNEALAQLARDNRQRMLGEEALCYLKRGTARAALGRPAEAAADLNRVLALEARTWVTGRAHAELGKLADLRGDRAAARASFDRAATLGRADNDDAAAAAAERWSRSGYTR